VQQQITVQFPSPQGEQTRDMLALLEADAAHTRLAAWPAARCWRASTGMAGTCA
jgi:hypothetical protein